MCKHTFYDNFRNRIPRWKRNHKPSPRIAENPSGRKLITNINIYLYSGPALILLYRREYIRFNNNNSTCKPGPVYTTAIIIINTHRIVLL